MRRYGVDAHRASTTSEGQNDDQNACFSFWVICRAATEADLAIFFAGLGVATSSLVSCPPS
jgi:hypothetical protein